MVHIIYPSIPYYGYTQWSKLFTAMAALPKWHTFTHSGILLCLSLFLNFKHTLPNKIFSIKVVTIAQPIQHIRGTIQELSSSEGYLV
jgi:hypothetical protein